MTDEGYIKFNAQWERTPPLPIASLTELQRWRRKLYGLSLIGAYEDGIGFGNISQRYGDADQFIISGSKTGNFAELTSMHYSLVTAVDIERNTLHCRGPVVASSESMSHVAVYSECPWVNGVIHVHDLEMWERLLHQVPTTARGATYGSPEMAYSIVRLLRETDLPERKIFVMEGHREGIFTFGRDLEEAGRILLDFVAR